MIPTNNTMVVAGIVTERTIAFNADPWQARECISEAEYSLRSMEEKVMRQVRQIKCAKSELNRLKQVLLKELRK